MDDHLFPCRLLGKGRSIEPEDRNVNLALGVRTLVNRLHPVPAIPLPSNTAAAPLAGVFVTMNLLPVFPRIALITCLSLGGGVIGFSAPVHSLAVAESTLQAVQGTKFQMQPPTGFVPADRFSGFVQESTRSSILITELPAPFASLKSGLSDPAVWQQRQITLLAQTSVQIQGQDALLLQLEQFAQAEEWLKWVLVFGDDQSTTLITATFPKGQESRLSEPLKRSVLSVELNTSQPPGAIAAVEFQVQPAGDMALALNLSNSKLFSKQGALPSEKPEDPIFVVAPSLNSQTILDRADFAKQRLLQTDKMEDIQIKTQAPITIDGLSGIAITATGMDSQTQSPMTIYQVLLFEPDQNYFILQGIVGRAIADQYLPIFQQMAQSFQRTSRTE